MYVELNLKLIADHPTDRQTDGWTLTRIELLSQLKIKNNNKVLVAAVLTWNPIFDFN